MLPEVWIEQFDLFSQEAEIGFNGIPWHNNIVGFNDVNRKKSLV